MIFSRYYDGTDDYSTVEMPTLASTSLPTIACWVKFHAWPGAGEDCFLSLSSFDTGIGQRWSIQVTTGGSLVYYTTSSSASSSFFMKLGVWHFVAWQARGSATNAAWFDGNRVATTATMGTISSIDQLTVGVYDNTGTKSGYANCEVARPVVWLGDSTAGQFPDQELMRMYQGWSPEHLTRGARLLSYDFKGGDFDFPTGSRHETPFYTTYGNVMAHTGGDARVSGLVAQKGERDYWAYREDGGAGIPPIERKRTTRLGKAAVPESSSGT